MILRPLATIALGTLAACNAAGMPASSDGSRGVTIDVNLTLGPTVTTVAVGSRIHFTNTDSFTHTASLILRATPFSKGSPFALSALMQHGTTLSGGFSSGALQPGSSSQTITADRAGTYLVGCFFHYGPPMRAAIVAQ
jgi:plastocyanin